MVVASTSVENIHTTQVVDQMEVLSVMIDALWLYLRSIEVDETANGELHQKLQQANDSLYEIMSYLEENS